MPAYLSRACPALGGGGQRSLQFLPAKFTRGYGGLARQFTAHCGIFGSK